MVLKKIKIAKTILGLDSPDSEVSEMFESFTPDNPIEYHSSPRTTIGGTYENLDKFAFYRPKVEFSLNLLFLQEYEKFYEVFNTRSFFIEYDDVFGRVRRNVYLGDHGRTFHKHKTNLRAITGIKFNFISRLGYRMTDSVGNDIGMDFLKTNLLTDVDGRF